MRYSHLDLVIFPIYPNRLLFGQLVRPDLFTNDRAIDTCAGGCKWGCLQRSPVQAFELCKWDGECCGPPEVEEF